MRTRKLRTTRAATKIASAAASHETLRLSVYTVAITRSATTSSTTATVTMKARRRSGKRGPTSASRPSANAVSVDIATPQPCADGRPASKARKIATATVMPPIEASSGRAKRRRSLSSPRSNSRRASSPTTKKKNVIRPLFTQWRKSSATLAPPTRIESVVPHRESYDEASTFTQTSAATAAASRTAAPPVSVRRNSRSGVSRLRAQAVRPENGAAAGSACKEIVELRRVRTPGRLEVRPVPARRFRAGLVRALQERQQRRPRIARRTHGLVGKHRQRSASELAPDRFGRAQRPVAKPVRLGRRVRVVGRLAHVLVAGPEPEGDDLVRVRLPRHGIRARNRRSAPRPEASDGEVEAVPEEVHGARLAAEPAGELLEDRVRPVEDVPEALDGVPVVGRVLPVGGKRRRHRHPERRLADRDVDAEPRQERVQARVELGHREPVHEPERLDRAAARLDDETVLDEVESDLEARAVLVVHAPRRQPPHVHVQRNVPPVIPRSSGRQAHLADDLHPEVQRVLRGLPLCERKLGQRSRHDVSSTNATSSTKHQLQSSPGSAERAIG